LFFLNDEEKEDVSADEVESMITKLTTKYREDIKSNNDCNESVRDEIKHFLILARKEHLWSPAEMYNFLQHGLKSTFPSVETLLRIYLTIPISNATGERSFSALKRIKNVQRNMIGQIRHNALAILNIESDETKKIWTR
jgi:hypothetical protein